MRAKYTQEEVVEIFRQGGCTLIGKYINVFTPVEYICKCGNQSKIALHDFKKGCRCLKCAGLEKLTTAKVKELMAKEGCELLSEYKNSKTLLDYRCSCGRISKITWGNFQQGSRCRQCGLEKIRGENSPHWKTELTDEDRKKDRNSIENTHWRTSIYQKDKYTCKCCGKPGNGDLNAHHYYNYTKYPEYRFRLDNGITLCKPCHDEYHIEYGWTDNSKVEFFLYLYSKRIGIDQSEIGQTTSPEIEAIIKKALTEYNDLHLEEQAS